MSTLLAVGDLHVTTEASLSFPELSDPVDLVLCVGDVVSSTTEPRAGRRSPALSVGRTILQALSREIAPVLYVPGNHDYREQDQLTDVDGVYNLETGPHQSAKATVVGFGSNRFNDGVEFPYLDDEWLDRPQTEVESWLSSLRERTALEDVSRPDGIDYPDEYIRRFERRYAELAGRLADHANPIFLLTHVPPFNTNLDVIQEEQSPLVGKHWGSVAVRHALRHFEPNVCISGHIHRSKGTAKVHDVPCVNPGYRGAYRIDVGSDGVEMTETPLIVKTGGGP